MKTTKTIAILFLLMGCGDSDGSTLEVTSQSVRQGKYGSEPTPPTPPPDSNQYPYNLKIKEPVTASDPESGQSVTRYPEEDPEPVVVPHQPLPTTTPSKPAAPTDTTVYPRWVLRDRHGQPVRAMVQPIYANADDGQLMGQTPICFEVEALGPDTWKGRYRLDTGAMDESCYTQFELKYYGDYGCDDPVTKDPEIVGYHNGVPKYGGRRLANGSDVYHETHLKLCRTEPSAVSQESPFYALTPVPLEHMNAFVKSAPYSLQVEYD